MQSNDCITFYYKRPSSAGVACAGNKVSPSQTAGQVLYLLGQLFDLLRLLNHGKREHIGGIRFLHFVLQLSGESVDFLDILMDLALILFENRLRIKLGSVWQTRSGQWNRRRCRWSGILSSLGLGDTSAQADAEVNSYRRRNHQREKI